MSFWKSFVMAIKFCKSSFTNPPLDWCWPLSQTYSQLIASASSHVISALTENLFWFQYPDPNIPTHSFEPSASSPVSITHLSSHRLFIPCLALPLISCLGRFVSLTSTPCEIAGYSFACISSIFFCCPDPRWCFGSQCLAKRIIRIDVAGTIA